MPTPAANPGRKGKKMNSKIKFVRETYAYGETWYHIVYNSRRVRTVIAEKLPSSAKDFISHAGTVEKQYDSIFKRDEIIYS